MRHGSVLVAIFMIGMARRVELELQIFPYNSDLGTYFGPGKFRSYPDSARIEILARRFEHVAAAGGG